MVSVEYSSLVITHLFYKVTLVVAFVRWILYWAFRFMGPGLSNSASMEVGQSPSLPSPVSAQVVRDSLHVATYGEIEGRLPESSGTCAVCLNDLFCEDEVWDLRNCCHIFHKRCLDRWLDHDEYKTCPLCRAPLMGHDLGLGRTEPSWAVERLLYLFGDDLLVGM